MDYLWRYIIPLAVTALGLAVANRLQDNTGVREYCEGEEFQARCSPDEVVVVQVAQYGRMNLGRCLGVNYGNVGCLADIRPQMDAWCSGRHECDVRVSSIIDHIPAENNPCPRDFRSYLAVSYTCVKVIRRSEAECKSKPFAVITTPLTGFIASTITEETNCGSLDCPWSVQIPSGQTVKLTLYDFAVATRDTASFVQNVPNTCHVYAVIKERTIKASDTVCGSNVRESWVYSSITNNVEIRLVAARQRKDKDAAQFIIKYEITGCADLPPPAFGWVERLEGNALFGCNDTKESWRLTCEGSKWTGQHKNCTRAEASSKSIGNTIIGIFTGSQWAAIVIILAIAITLGLIIFLIGLIYLKRRRRNREGGHGGDYRHSQAIPDYYSTQYHQPGGPRGPPGYSSSKPLSALDNYSSAENDYYRTWQLQRHPPAGMQFNTTADGDRPVMEHIYESPKFDRREMNLSPPPLPISVMDSGDLGTGTGPGPVQYYELDPNAIDPHSSQSGHMTG